MKNILFLEQFSKISGGQKVLLQIIDSLDKKTYGVQVVLPQKGELSEELEKRSVKYHLFPIGSYSAGKKTLWDMVRYLLLSFILVPLTVFLIKKENISLVYANAPRTYLWGSIAANFARKPIIWHVHSIFSGLELALCHVIRSVLRVDKIMAISKSVAKPFLQNDHTKVHVIYNGVDCEQFAPSKYDAQEIRRELGIPTDFKVIGYIGQLARWKGIEDYIKAAKHTLEAQQNIIFLIIGDVLFGAKRYKLELEQLVNKLGISDKVKFLGWRKDIPKLLAVVDILVVPSIKPEPLSLALLEGMAAGKAVVASAHGGPAEIIEDGVDGKLFPPGDFSALAKIILLLLKDPEQARKLGETAQQKAIENFSLPKQMQKIHDIISETL